MASAMRPPMASLMASVKQSPMQSVMALAMAWAWKTQLPYPLPLSSLVPYPYLVTTPWISNGDKGLGLQAGNWRVGVRA